MSKKNKKKYQLFEIHVFVNMNSCVFNQEYPFYILKLFLARVRRRMMLGGGYKFVQIFIIMAWQNLQLHDVTIREIIDYSCLDTASEYLLRSFFSNWSSRSFHLLWQCITLSKLQMHWLLPYEKIDVA